MSLQIFKLIVLAEAKLGHFKGQYFFERVYGHQVQYVGPSGLKNVLQVALTITFHKLILIFLYLKQVLSNEEENKKILLFLLKWQKVQRELTWRGSAVLKRQFSIAHNFCAFCVR